MKFVVSALSKCEPRLGTLTHLNTHQLETPTAMLYTQGGSIPHITRDVYKMFAQTPTNILQIPLVSTYTFIEALKEFKGNIASFVGMKDCLTCMTLQDPGTLTLPGHHTKSSIPIWTRGGKILVNSESYMDAMETFKPDMYYFLSDGDTNITSPTKRVLKAVDRTVTFYRECLDRHRKSEVLKNSFVMAGISGGYCLKARDWCIKEISKDIEGISGFLIDGLHNNSPEVEFMEFEEIKPVVEFVISKVPPDKIRVIHGCYNPLTILKLIKVGVDLFDTSYCYLATERSAALTFALNPSETEYEYEINLRQQKFAEDFEPVMKDCDCLTCTSYSRGYIHHLLTVQELLGPVLLSIHNIHHFMKFLSVVRQCIKDGTLDELEEFLSKQFRSFISNIPGKDIPSESVIPVGDTV